MKQLLWPAVLAAALTCGGCGHTAKRRHRVQTQLDEHSRALTSAVVDTLQLQHDPDEHSRLALELARQDQFIEGPPAQPIQVLDLIGASNLAPRFEAIHRLLEQRRRLDERLINYGTRWEQERNAQRLRWTAWIGSGSLLIGGLIALCVFFPVALPILGRVLAWLTGKIPAFAGALGVVGVKAFDAVVRGVEKSRSTSTQTFTNEPGRPGPDLDAHLARAMDADHKALVRARKTALRL